MKRNNPFDSLLDSLFILVDYEFEGSNITEEEYEYNKKRFISAFRYICATTERFEKIEDKDSE